MDEDLCPCFTGKRIINTYGENSCVTIEWGSLEFDPSDSYYSETIDISFCPLCGRDLKEY